MAVGRLMALWWPSPARRGSGNTQREGYAGPWRCFGAEQRRRIERPSSVGENPRPRAAAERRPSGSASGAASASSASASASAVAEGGVGWCVRAASRLDLGGRWAAAVGFSPPYSQLPGEAEGAAAMTNAALSFKAKRLSPMVAALDIAGTLRVWDAKGNFTLVAAADAHSSVTVLPLPDATPLLRGDVNEDTAAAVTTAAVAATADSAALGGGGGLEVEEQRIVTGRGTALHWIGPARIATGGQGGASGGAVRIIDVVSAEVLEEAATAAGEAEVLRQEHEERVAEQVNRANENDGSDEEEMEGGGKNGRLDMEGLGQVERRSSVVEERSRSGVAPTNGSGDGRGFLQRARRRRDRVGSREAAAARHIESNRRRPTSSRPRPSPCSAAEPTPACRSYHFCRRRTTKNWCHRHRRRFVIKVGGWPVGWCTLRLSWPMAGQGQAQRCNKSSPTNLLASRRRSDRTRRRSKVAEAVVPSRSKRKHKPKPPPRRRRRRRRRRRSRVEQCFCRC